MTAAAGAGRYMGLVDGVKTSLPMPRTGEAWEWGFAWDTATGWPIWLRGDNLRELAFSGLGTPILDATRGTRYVYIQAGGVIQPALDDPDIPTHARYTLVPRAGRTWMRFPSRDGDVQYAKFVRYLNGAAPEILSLRQGIWIPLTAESRVADAI